MLHETLSAFVDQNAAFTANGLGNQEGFDRGVVEASGMELDEFHIRNHRPGPPSHGNAVAGRDIGIRRIEIHFSTSPRGGHGHIGAQGFYDAGGLIEHIDTEATILHGVAEFAGGDEIHGHVVFHHFDSGMLGDALEKSGFNLSSSGVAGMQDAAFRMPSFSAEIWLHRAVAIFPLIKMNAKPGEFRNPCGTFRDNRADDILVAKPCAGGQRVAHMEVERILAGHYASDAALGPGGIRVRRRAFCDDGDGSFLSGFQREGQTRNATAKDDKIKFSHGMAGSGMLSINLAFPRNTAAAKRPSVRRWRKG